MPYQYDSREEHFMKEHDMVFSKSKNGTITGGGFAIDSMLLKNITQYGEYPNENLDNMIGGENTYENMKTRAVPVGLFYKQEEKTHKNSNNSSVVDMDMDVDMDKNNEISDEIYEELLKKVNANDDSYEKSKKTNKSEKKKSRKNLKLPKKKTAKSIHT